MTFRGLARAWKYQPMTLTHRITEKWEELNADTPFPGFDTIQTFAARSEPKNWRTLEF
jgi:hypothetical protein